MRIGDMVSVRINKDRQPILGRLIDVDMAKGEGIVIVRGQQVRRDLKRIYNKRLAIQAYCQEMRGKTPR